MATEGSSHGGAGQPEMESTLVNRTTDNSSVGQYYADLGEPAAEQVEYDEEQLYNEVYAYETEISEVTDEFRATLQALVELGHIRQGIYNERYVYRARDGLKWSDFVNIDNPLVKQILKTMIGNPKTFFVLYNTQKGKLRIAAHEINTWAQDPTYKPVAFVMVDNDKTLADQSESGIDKITSQTAKIFLLSSNSSTKMDDMKIYIDAYAADKDGEYKMPVILFLANDKQTGKVVKLMTYIRRKASQSSPLRYGIVFDEADKVYPPFRNKKFEGVSLFDLIKDEALYKMGFVTATEGKLLDEEYEECANAHLYETFDTDDHIHYRALHHEESIVKTVKHPVSMDNNTYALKILSDNLSHFTTPVRGQYRKTIVNSNASAEKMKDFARKSVDMGMNAMTFNMNGVRLYRTGKEVERFNVRGRKFNEVLFEIYKDFGLHDKPLIIIGRRKVDRGLGFHYAPRDGSEGLVWTDIVLGRIDDKATAVQKAGRGAGIIAQCPQYIGSVTYWTDEQTANTIKRHNQVVDKANTMRGCSVLQAVRHAEDLTPHVPTQCPYNISTDTFVTVEEAKAWADANIPRTYKKDGKDVPYKASAYGLYDENGRKGTTHIKYRGEPKAIMTEEEVRNSTDLGYGVASSPRIMPVLSGLIIRYIIIYRKE